MIDSEHLKAIADHHDEALGYHREVVDRQADLRVGFAQLRDLVARAKRAHADGRHADVGNILGDIGTEADLGRDYHADACDSERALGRSIKASQGLVGEALRAAREEESYADPTKAMGAQTSDGQQPRASTVEEIHQRDRRRGVLACYNARMAQERHR